LLYLLRLRKTVNTRCILGGCATGLEMSPMVYPGGLSCHRNESSTHRARRTTFEFPDKDGKTKTRAISVRSYVSACK
jgi:hypothetical protein